MNILKASSSFFAFAFCVFFLNAQTISIDSTFTSDGEIFPFSQNDTAYGIKMSGDIVLNSDTSLVRVIFTDADSIDYMVFETYPLISLRSSFSVADVYDETFCLDELTPLSIRVEIINASLYLDEIVVSQEQCSNSELDRYTAKRSLDAKKVDTLKIRINGFGMDWVASDNSEVALYYEDKVGLYGEKYNLLGLDYYQSGVYEELGNMDYVAESSALVRQFDWRSKHDANDTTSMYWDSNYDNSGWITKKSDQGGCGSCWVFGPVAVFEGLTNLYYNNHYDFDLSEQYLFSCSDNVDCNDGGHPSRAIDNC